MFGVLLCNEIYWLNESKFCRDKCHWSTSNLSEMAKNILGQDFVLNVNGYSVRKMSLSKLEKECYCGMTLYMQTQEQSSSLDLRWTLWLGWHTHVSTDSYLGMWQKKKVATVQMRIRTRLHSLFCMLIFLCLFFFNDPPEYSLSEFFTIHDDVAKFKSLTWI